MISNKLKKEIHRINNEAQNELAELWLRKMGVPMPEVRRKPEPRMCVQCWPYRDTHATHYVWSYLADLPPWEVCINHARQAHELGLRVKLIESGYNDG